MEHTERISLLHGLLTRNRYALSNDRLMREARCSRSNLYRDLSFMTRQKKPTTSLIRSSAAEYLTFVAASGEGGVEAVYADENVWLSQKMMAQLYDVEVPTINYHLKKVFDDSELDASAVIRNFRITAADGKTYVTTSRHRQSSCCGRQAAMCCRSPKTEANAC